LEITARTEYRPITSPSISRKAAIGAGYLLAVRVISRALGFASTLVMARLLAPADFGIIAMATAFSAAIDAFSQIGLQQALLRRESEDDALHNTAFTLQLGRALITGACIVLTAPLVSRWFDEPRLLQVLLVLAAISVISGGRNIGVVAFDRAMDFRPQFLIQAIPRLIQVPVTIGMGLWLQSYWALVIGIALSKLLDVAMTYILHPYRPRLSLHGWRELTAFSLWTWAASLAAVAWDRCDPFVIGPVLGSEQLGIYLLGAELALLPITELVSPAADILLMGFSMAQRQGSRAATLALPTATALASLMMPLMIGVSATSGYLVVGVLGAKWLSAQPVIAIATWAGLFAPFSYVCQQALIAAGHLRANLIANSLASLLKLSVLSAVVALTSDLSRISEAGVVIVAGEAAIFVLLLCRSEVTHSRAVLGNLGRIVLAGVITAAVPVGLGLPWAEVTLPGWSALLVGGGIGIGIIGGFGAASYVIWWIAGRPEGAETRVAGLISHVSASVIGRFVR
jgi:O-antigen/teichoic acid export membrane protein